MEELANSNVKHNMEDVVLVTKNYDGMLLWLETGSSSSGLKHILEEHATNFAKRGISDIPQFLSDVLEARPVKYGCNSRGLFAEYIFNDNTYRIAYGTNGYLVSFFPIN